METTQTPITSIPFWRQLRWSLVLTYVLLAVVPVIVVVVFTSYQANDQIRKQAVQQLKSIAELKKSQISRWLSDSQVTLDLFLSEPTREERFRDFAAATLRAELDTATLETERKALGDLLRDAVLAQEFFQEIFFYNTDGRVIAGSLLNEVGQVVSRQPYFQGSLVGPVIQSPYYPPGTDELTIVITRRLVDNNGQTVGVLAGRLDLNDLNEIMTERTGLGNTGETYLVSREGNYMVTPSLSEGYVLTQPYYSDGIERALSGVVIGEGTYLDYRDPPVKVIGVYLWLDDLQVAMLAEKSEAEALAPYERALVSSTAWAAVAALAMIVLGFFIATRISNPIVALTEVASRIAGGDLERRAEVGQRNEIGVLATAFNSMTSQSRELIDSLEQRVAQRTRELQASAADLAAQSAELESAYQQQARVNRDLEQTINQSRKRALLLTASSQVSRAITRITDMDQLLTEVTHLISHHFGFYHVGVFMLDEARRYAVLRAANSEGGQRMLARQHKLAVGAEGIVGYVTSTGQPRIALSVGADAVHFTNPDLPDTLSEMALPMRSGDEIIGALDIQSVEEAAFAEEDVAVLSTMADQIAIAIQNVLLLRQTRAALQESRQVQQRYFQQEWSQFTREQPVSSHEYIIQGVSPVGDTPLPEIEQAWREGKIVASQAPTEQEGAPFRTALAAPIKVQDAVIGVLDLHEADTDRVWSEDEIALVQDVADQVGQALQSARLFAATRQRARREELTRRITDRIRAASDIEGILQTAAEELGRALDVSRSVARLSTQVEQPLAIPTSSPQEETDVEQS
jgi:GAF domain-containing protein/HAMP domain-containing protein